MNIRRFVVCFLGMLIPLHLLANEGHEIVSLNPQLKTIPDWPPLSSNTGNVGAPEDCNKCARQYALNSMRQRGDTPFRCVFYEGKFGGKAWESGAGETKHFTLQLHPNSPKVWRVFPQGGYYGDAQRSLIAEFDVQGNLIFSRSARSNIAVLNKGEDRNSKDCPNGLPYH